MGLLSLFIGGPSGLLVYAEEMEFVPASDESSEVASIDKVSNHDSSESEIKKKDSPESLSEKKPEALSADEKFLDSIKGELDVARNEYLLIDENLEEIEEKIEEVKSEAISLKRQLSLLGHQMRHAEIMIENVQKQISKKEGELAGLMDEVQIKKIEMQDLQRIMVEYLQAMYVQRNLYADIGDQKGFDRAVKILFSDDSVSETLQQNFYYAFMEEQGNDLLKQFMAAKGVLQVKQHEMELAKLKLEKLRYHLKQDRKRYHLQKVAQEELLNETEGKEEIYKQLVEQSRRQQNEIVQEISDLQHNVKKVQANMKKYGDYFDVKDYREMVKKSVTGINEQDDSGVEFRWPVQPSLGISAYYHDPSYKRVFGVNHNAIDLPSAQGTPLRAAEAAVVYKARDNGMGYSYIVLAHKGGYMTLYGHVSKIAVSPGEKVYKGQIIGLSGGTPGTKGAGYMTTGAHLHFEMFKGGKHIDPLTKLPLSYLPLSSVPEKYLKYLKDSRKR